MSDTDKRPKREDSEKRGPCPECGRGVHKDGSHTLSCSRRGKRYPWEDTYVSDRTGVFSAEIDIAGLASEVGYLAGEYEVSGVEYEGDGQIRVHFQTIDTESETDEQSEGS